MKKYITPDFDVTIYEIEDVITSSGNIEIDKNDPDGEDWFG